MRAGSQNYDGGVPPGRSAKKLTLAGREPAVGPPRERHPMHGVGAQSGLRYCACGAKKTNGVCPRCAA